jgi:hypothetical protein
MSLAQLFPEGVGLIIMGYVPQYERDVVFIHELVAGNLFFGCSNPRDYCLKNLLPKFAEVNPEDYFRRIEMGPRKYQMQRYLKNFRPVEQYALFEYCLSELSDALHFGRRIRSRLSFQQYDFKWFRNACSMEAVGESWDEMSQRVKAVCEPERKVQIEVVLKATGQPKSYTEPDVLTEEEKAVARAKAKEFYDSLIKAKEEADARVEAKRLEKLREARKKEKEAAKKEKLAAEALKALKKKKK